MTDIRFYHMTVQSLDQALPAILAKALDAGHRVVVKCANDAQVTRLNDLLWTYKPDSFLPHGMAKDGHSADQPVYLTADNDNPGGAGVLVLAGGAASEALGDYTLCCEMLDGHDGVAVESARERWKLYKDAGHTLTYWQQNAAGGWDKKA